MVDNQVITVPDSGLGTSAYLVDRGDGQGTGWDPPRRIVYKEDWAALMGKDPDALSPLTSEFLVEAQSGGILDRLADRLLLVGHEDDPERSRSRRRCRRGQVRGSP